MRRTRPIWPHWPGWLPKIPLLRSALKNCVC